MKRSPAAALWLSLLPGLGHVYIGRVQTGTALVALFATAWYLTDEVSDIFLFGVFFIWMYSMIEAYRGAQDYNRILDAGGTPPRSEPLVFNRWWGFGLIGLGVLIMLGNLGIFDSDFFETFWPLGLIALGIYLLRRPPRALPESETAPPPQEPPLPQPEPTVSDEPGAVDESTAETEDAGPPDVPVSTASHDEETRREHE